MLTERLLSFDEWQMMIEREGGDLPEDVTQQNQLYEKYIASFKDEE